MNILEVIRDCITNPNLLKEYELQEYTCEVPSQFDIISVVKTSSFSGNTTINQNLINGKNQKISQIDAKLQKLYMRIWSAFGSFISRETSKGNCAVSLQLGYFYPCNSDTAVPATTRICYSPTLELLEKYKLTIKEDEFNFPPLKREVFTF